MDNVHVYFITFSSIIVLTFSAKQYIGPFNLSVKSFEFCKGPKAKDCTVGSVNITSDNTVSLELAVIENAALDKAKVMLFLPENNETFRMQFNKPCENLFLMPIFEVLFNASSRCIVPKGLYKVSMNLNDLFHKYYGGNCIYGTQRWKSSFYSKDCNFVCTKSVVVMSPIK